MKKQSNIGWIIATVLMFIGALYFAIRITQGFIG